MPPRKPTAPNRRTLTLMGQVTLSYDDERTTRDALVEVLSRGGFREQLFV